MRIDWRKQGFCDGLFGRESEAPKDWHNSSVYLIGFLEGKESRKKYGIDLTIAKENKACK